MTPRRTITVLVAVAFVASCASLGVRGNAVQQVQAIDAVLSSVQDVEISLFESGTITALTAEKHRAFHGILARAFEAEERLAVTIKAWRAGDPAPSGAAEILATAQEAVTVLTGVVPEGQTLWSHVQTWLGFAIELQQIIGGSE